MVWRAHDPQGFEAEKVKHAIVRYTRGNGMDLGCGQRKAFPHFLGVDSKKDTELFGIQMKPDIEGDCTRPSSFAKPEAADFIFSSHLLEHIEDHRAALADWWSCIRVGGYLVLYLPHADWYPRIGQPGANTDHKHDFLPADIISAMKGIGSWDLVVNETRTDDREYSFLQVYQKIENVAIVESEAALFTHSYSCEQPRPEKTVCIVRHGGFGDQLQAAALFPELKRQGFHVTVLTTPHGRSVIENDPNVDDWFMVDKDQVPNHELVAFWRETARHYDRFVNLNESVEGTFLAMEGRPAFSWPHVVRHKMLDRNYAEFAADLAQIPFKPEGQFYPTPAEVLWATDYLRDLTVAMDPDAGKPRPLGVVIPKPYVVMFALSGSSVHKATPHGDTVINWIVTKLRRAIVVMVGDYACQLLEQGWEQHPRVRCESGKLSIRQTLTLAQRVNLLLGPETGVLNSVAYDANVSKVTLLSHSSHENLTKHWVNNTSIAGVAPCYPCHQLHSSGDHCPREESTRAAVCQYNVSPNAIFWPIEQDYTGWARVQMMRSAA